MGPGRTNLKQRTLAMAALAVALVVAIVLRQVWQSYQITVQNARRDIAELTQALSTSADATFRSAELIIDRIVEEMHGTNPGAQAAELAAPLITAGDKWPFVYAEVFIDAGGTQRLEVLRNTEGHLTVSPPGRDFRELRSFYFHRDAKPEQFQSFFISQPFQRDDSGVWVLAVSKAVRGPSGVLKGVGVILITLNTFDHLFAGVLPATYRAAAMRRLDGSLILSTQVDPSIGEKRAQPPLYTSWPPPKPTGVVKYTTAEKNEALVGYQVLGAYPVLVAVSTNWDQVLRDWKRNSLAFMGSALVGVLMIAALTRGVIRQIEAQQRGQLALSRNEHRLAESQRLSGIAHFERVVATDEIRWGENMYAIHGLNPADFTPSWEAFMSLVLPEDRVRVVEACGGEIKKPGDMPRPTGNFECRIKVPPAEIKHMRYSWRVVDDGPGTPKRVFGVAQDMTAIRTAESVIREDEERLRDIVECSSDYIWESDAAGRTIFFAGAEAHKFSGPDSAWPTILPITPIGSGDTASLFEAACMRQKIRSLIVQWPDISGEGHWIRISANPRFDADGQFVGYRGAAADVTETVRQSMRAEDDRRSEAIGRLASGLAHEINNLLQPIIIYAAFGRAAEGITQKVQQYFARIAKAADNASHIVKNVLSFANRDQLPHELVNPGEVARESIDLLSGALRPGVTVELKIQADDYVVRVNRTALAQVVTNLVANATDAVADGGRVVVTVESVALTHDAAASLSLAPQLYCRIAVEDNGPGIAPANIGKVFEPFFTTKPQGQGTGLGLSVVSGLVKGWSGTVAAESAPGRNTCFTVYLPATARLLQAAQ